jgi:hypothetical protein
MARPLVFPAHFPPKTRWKKFFVGLRWLGPDLSFFDELKAQQAARSLDDMCLWGGGTRQEIAEFVSQEIAFRRRWKTAYFLPQDSLFVALNGPRYKEMDDFIHEDVIDLVNERYGIDLPETYWRGKASDMTMGAFVDDVLRAGG